VEIKKLRTTRATHVRVNMSTHTRAFTRPRTTFSVRRGFRRTPMVRRIKFARPSKVSRFQASPSIPPEQKNIDTFTAGTLITNNTLAPVASFNIAQGAGPGQRVSRRVILKSLYYRVAAGCGAFRVIAIFDKQPNGVQAGVAEIFTNATFVAAMNLARSDRFIVLSDQTYMSNDTGITSGTSNIVVGHRYTKISLDSVYDDSGAGAPTTGNILLFAAPLGVNAVAPNTLDIQTRLRYTDV